MSQEFFRGGSSLTPRPGDIRLDPATGLLRPGRGVSVFDHPEGLDRFGGAFRVTELPDSLRIIQVGRNPHHYEIVAAAPMTARDYERELGHIVLVPVETSEEQ